MNKNNVISVSVEKLKRDLSPLFRKHAAIESAYLFGSTTQGVNHRFSDVDIGIRLTDSVSPLLSFDIRMKLMHDLEDYFGRNVDVVILNTASLKLIHQVLQTGKIVFAKDPEKDMDYAIQKQKEFFDFKYYIDRDIQELRRYFEAN